MAPRKTTNMMITDSKGREAPRRRAPVGLESEGVARSIKTQLRSTATIVIQTAPVPSRPLVGAHALAGNRWIAGLASTKRLLAVDLCN